MFPKLLFPKMFFVFVFFLFLNDPVNSYGHVSMVTSDFVELLPTIEMNKTCNS